MKINIPERAEILKRGVAVSVSPRGKKWLQNCLGKFASEKGVYVIHYRDSIKYIGKTNGASMSFGMRMRRHFQESAAGNKHTYPKLVSLLNPPVIKVSMFPLAEIKEYILHDVINPNEKDLIPLFEAALIVAFKPEFQC